MRARGLTVLASLTAVLLGGGSTATASSRDARAAATAASDSVTPAASDSATPAPAPAGSDSAAPAPAQAGAAAGPARPSTTVEEIVIKGEVPTRIDTLEVREVRESFARDLAEALAQHGVAAAIRRGGIASDVVVRGFQRDAVSVTIDGARLHGACPNRMDPPSFHIDYAEVDRVELRKGPFDVASPGSIGGMLDVRTRTPADGLSGEASAGYAGFGGYDVAGTMGYGAGGRGALAGIAFKTSQAFESGGGLRFTELYAADSANRYRSDAQGTDAYTVRSGWAKGTLAEGDHRLELSLARQDGDRVLYPYLKMDARYDDTTRARLGYEVGDVGPLARVRASAWVSHVAHDMDDALRCSSAQAPAACGDTLARGWSMRTDARARVTGGSLEGSIAGDGETTAGADFYLRSWSATTTRFRRATSEYYDETSVPDVRIVDLGLRAEHVRDVGPRLRVSAGGRLDLARSSPGADRAAAYATYHDDLPAELTRDDLLVSANVQADLALAGGVSLFLGLGRGVRLPDPQERYFALSSQLMGTTLVAGTIGDPGLRPTANHELDVGLKAVSGRFLVKLQGFASWLTDWVTPARIASRDDPALEAKTYANVDATLWGGEASARVALPWRLGVLATAAYVRGDDRTHDVPLPEMPPLRGTLALRYEGAMAFAEAQTAFAAAQRRVAPALREEETPGWATLSLRAGVQLAGVKVFAGVSNVLDRDYYDSLSYLRDPFASGLRVPEPGRVVQASAQVTF